jgi:8-oxo-dGTP pyrophosphatase MutT (NUDIX family)
VARLTVKLLLLDEQDHLLLIHSRDPSGSGDCWYPVGGGVEPGETAQQAAVREAAEETGLLALSVGAPVWIRDHTYRYDGREVAVHEEWLLHRVDHFDPAPAALTDYESKTIQGFRWWSIEDLVKTTDTVYPPRLGHRLSSLLKDGLPPIPIDISD